MTKPNKPDAAASTENAPDIQAIVDAAVAAALANAAPVAEVKEATPAFKPTKVDIAHKATLETF